MTAGRAALVCLGLLLSGCHHRRARVVRHHHIDAAVASMTNVGVPDAGVPDAGVPDTATGVPEIVPDAKRGQLIGHDGHTASFDLGSDLPTSRPPSPRCRTGADVTAWLSHDPHVPLARVTARGIERVGQECCEPFAVLGSRWREIDRWGQVVGESTVRDGAYYDHTHCLELSFSIEHRASAGLFASASGPWRPSPSLRHDPDRAQWTAALELDGRVGALHPEGHDWANSGRALANRTLFFRWRGASSRGSTAETGDWLVLGGYGLVIARWRHDRWETVDRVRYHRGGGRVTPIGVFDLDGDGAPEVIIEDNLDGAWNSTIYKRSPAGEWRAVATSIHGSTA